jgi:hypothetical protein
MIAYALVLAGLTALFVAPRLGWRAGLVAFLGIAIDLATVPQSMAFDGRLPTSILLCDPAWVALALYGGLAMLTGGIAIALLDGPGRIGHGPRRLSIGLVSASLVGLAALATAQSAALATDWLFGITIAA